MHRACQRAVVYGALHGGRDDGGPKKVPVFGLEVPRAIEKVPAEILDPRGTWKDGAAYDAQAKKLAKMFRENFEKFGSVDSATKNAGPKG